jgi:hypothetical protein
MNGGPCIVMKNKIVDSQGYNDWKAMAKLVKFLRGSQIQNIK